MLDLINQKGNIYRRKDESSVIRTGNFKITNFHSKQEVSEARIQGSDWVSRSPGHSKTYFTVEGTADTPIGIGDKMFFRSHPTIGTKSFYQWWGTFTGFFPAADGSNIFTGQITVEDMKLTTD